MGSTVPGIRSHKPNVALHGFGLKGAFPQSSVTLRGGKLTWIGEVRPTKLSAKYTVRIKYPGQGRPVITVLSPRLSMPEGKPLPHVYPGDELCLYFPGQWTESMSMATTIVPWTSEWLLHYEIWRATGAWTGGGHEVGDGQKKDSD
jgi:hypothetical protein